MPGLRDNASRRSKALARQVLSGAGLFDVDKMRISYWRGDGTHHLEVTVPGYRMEVTSLSSLDLPGYPELIEAAHDHQVRHAPKPPRRKKCSTTR